MRPDRSDADPSLATVNAFPVALRGEADAVASILPGATHQPAGSFTVNVDEELVMIPYRLYNAEPPESAVAALSAVQREVLHCMYTRHHDGFVRQRHLEHVIGSTQPWVAPFVVQLVSEYVLPILVVIRDGLLDLDTPGTAQREVYGTFVAANARFFERTRQRVASYWHCYHRGAYADRRHYPGQMILDSMAQAAKTYEVGRSPLLPRTP